MPENTAPSPPPSDGSRAGLIIQTMIEAQATLAPGKPAVICRGQQLSFAALNARANQLARHLQSLGVGPETLVGLCVECSVEMAVGILGILKAGGAWLPLDPAYPKARLAFMLEHGRAPVLVTQSNLVASLPPHAARIVTLDTDWRASARNGTENFSTNVTPENLAYVIYTSGSTGRPKGVMISHANLAHYVQALSTPLGITAAARYLHTASISFSSSVRQLLVPLANGATVVIATRDLLRDPAALFREIKQQRVTVLDVVPSYWRNCLQILESLDAQTRAAALGDSLRLILCASEPLLPDLPRRWRSLFGPATRIINMYGLTETTGIVLLHPVLLDHSDVSDVVPIGRPIAGTSACLLDDQLRPVPAGATGQIHISGPGVARGYLHQPELTAEKFIPHPAQPGIRLHRTGDLGRERPDGTIESQGRTDEQIKINGIRIEPSEVEIRLLQIPGVRGAVVVGRENTAGHFQLVAYLETYPPDAPTDDTLRAALQQHLPDFMIPAVWVRLAELPRTATGKLLRTNLPAPTAPAATGPAPQTDTEKKLAALWCEVLERETIGAQDNFFTTGGNSLLATQLISRLRQIFPLEITWATLFQSSTISSLARVIDTLLLAARNSAPRATDQGRDEGEL